MTLKTLVSCMVCVFLLLSCNKQNDEAQKLITPYSKIELLSYSTARNTYELGDSLNVNKDVLQNPQLKIIDRLTLDEDQAQSVIKSILRPSPNPILADCYQPRHLLLFYKNDKLCDYYEFCVSCGGGIKSKKINLPLTDMKQGKQLIELFKSFKLKNTGEEGPNYLYF